MPAPIALALVLFLQGQPAAEAAAPPPAEAAAPPADAATPPEDRLPAGAPRDDYQFVGWCYGLLRGYLDLHDRVMPEVTRIESTYRPPDRKLSDDLKVYADMQKEGQAQLKLFRAALTAAEKASLKPINTVGAAAVSKGADVWNVTPDVTPARLAQEWMSWALPARCETVAKSLKANATLMGGAFKVNDEPAAPPPAAEAAPAPDAPAADTPKDPVSVLLAPPAAPAPPSPN
ncbi:hypothetical protein [Phenylobacterium sp.]|uniref:hypothetical protein n=1 Tax=Phenylobacterium sp. TaxID=1871053 RepID=UPI00122587F0|nr:hypothetical protein [Phenylobacterium sp.]THD59621.1 MAG: hypothetical protein E8A12_11355 [Phenylobacterium sp.]